MKTAVTPGLLALTVIMAPRGLRAQELPGRLTSPPILLMPLESSGVPAVSLFAFQGSQTPMIAGLSYSLPLGRRLALQAQGALGHQRPGDSPASAAEGLYAAGHLGTSFALEQGRSSSLRVFGGVQAAYRRGQRATRVSVPAGLALALGTRLGPVGLTPLAAMGVALRHDDANANRLFAGPLNAVGVGRTGWFAQLGLRVGVGSWWAEGSFGHDKQMDSDAAGMPPQPVPIDGLLLPREIRGEHRLSIRIGYDLRG
ncbi:MAG: hypothetical protein IRZ00_10935 [Gemmatimonadetes bacterium]|nr:hypothetical protein [Gemmatimonadota bacterium]